MLSTLHFIQAAVGALVCYFVARQYKGATRPSTYPPGPPTAPFIGNIHLIPLSQSYLKFKEWSDKYGDVMSLKLGTGTLIVLSSAEAVAELWDKRGAIYSDRPSSWLFHDVISKGELHLLLMRYGNTWRAVRKVFMSALNMNAVSSLAPLQEAEAAQTMKELCETPELYDNHVRRYATSVILASVFGKRGLSWDDPDVNRIYEVQDRFTEIIEPGNIPPVDFVPILNWLPPFLASWKRRADIVRKGQYDLYTGLLESTKKRLAQGSSVNCFMDRLLSKAEMEKHQLNNDRLAYVGGIMMEAGSDTTSSVLLGFILIMMKHPEIFKRAQKEVDAACGQDRSPVLQDSERLPYMKACLNELLRFRPPVPAVIPHALTEDDTYKGYLIPKGATVVANTVAIHFNPEDYEEPDIYNPDRFLKSELGIRPGKVPEKGRRVTYAFGGGRRVCAGQHLGEANLFINVSKLLWGFDILPPLREDGTAVSPSEINDDWDAFSSGVTATPKRYQCRIIPRSQKHVEIFKQDFQEAQSIYDAYKPRF